MGGPFFVGDYEGAAGSGVAVQIVSKNGTNIGIFT
jgi:hypothetical protein